MMNNEIKDTNKTNSNHKNKNQIGYKKQMIGHLYILACQCKT
jgi:hypothetical protein